MVSKSSRAFSRPSMQQGVFAFAMDQLVGDAMCAQGLEFGLVAQAVGAAIHMGNKGECPLVLHLMLMCLASRSN
ncbi:hypothetical protein [Nitrosovibrio sp. Nv6]|uniref:hypothetical protein n=1 Tax=Nitrosovibrio sp. Nv6 TaxID=1855340 RepID=UPI0008B586FB|nr:hypothetical protein [Nitrosovibrio sp. Nv6]SEP37048.1 hypothetical protein SAMN05216316_2665 [Nitrosovibrio sp. Nv6]